MWWKKEVEEPKAAQKVEFPEFPEFPKFPEFPQFPNFVNTTSTFDGTASLDVSFSLSDTKKPISVKLAHEKGFVTFKMNTEDARDLISKLQSAVKVAEVK